MLILSIHYFWLMLNIHSLASKNGCPVDYHCLCIILIFYKYFEYFCKNVKMDNISLLWHSTCLHTFHRVSNNILDEREWNQSERAWWEKQHWLGQRTTGSPAPFQWRKRRCVVSLLVAKPHITAHFASLFKSSNLAPKKGGTLRNIMSDTVSSNLCYRIELVCESRRERRTCRKWK